MEYRRDIDGLRALAILLVLAYHAFPAFCPGGFIGVDVFFVISGYLITGIIWREAAEGRFSFKTFYARRFRRLLPAFLVVILAVWVMAWFALWPAEFAVLGQHIMASASFGENLLLHHESGYFDLKSETKPLLHFWSLGVEEQFYIFWPTLLVFLSSRRLAKISKSSLLISSLLLLAALSFAFNITQIRYDASGVFYGLAARFWELLLGALIVFWPAMKARHPRGLWWWELGALIALIVMVGSAFLLNASLPYPGYRAIFPVLPTVYLIGTGRESRIARGLLGSRPLVFIGLISYPLYLWHWPILSFLRIAQGSRLPTAWIFGALALAFALATITWSWVERGAQGRFRWEQGRSHPRTVLVLGLVILLALNILGFATWQSRGFAQRHLEGEGSPSGVKAPFVLLESPHQILMETTDSLPCRGPLPENKNVICREPFPDRTTIAVWGDSHAEAVQLGFERLGVPSFMISSGSCPPLTQDSPGPDALVSEGCSLSYQGAVLEYLKNRREIATVVLVSMTSQYLDGIRGGTPYRIRFFDVDPGPDEKSRRFEKAYAHTIRELIKSGKRVILYEDHPEFRHGLDPHECGAARPLRFFESPTPLCNTDRAVFDAKNAIAERLYDELSAEVPQLERYRSADEFCHEQKCEGVIEGQITYIDGDHLSVAGALRVARRLQSRLDNKSSR